MKPYHFTKLTIASAVFTLCLAAPAWATDYADAIKGTWESTETVEAMSDGVNMVVAKSTRTYTGATGNRVYSLKLESADIPASIAKHRVEDSFAYFVEGDTLTERVLGADVIAASPGRDAVLMATRLEHLLSRPNKTTLKIEKLDDTSMVLYDESLKILYKFKRK